MAKLLADYLTEEQAAKELGRTVRALMHWRRHRRGPAYTKYGNTIVYRRGAILQWLQDQEVAPANARR